MANNRCRVGDVFRRSSREFALGRREAQATLAHRFSRWTPVEDSVLTTYSYLSIPAFFFFFVGSC